MDPGDGPLSENWRFVKSECCNNLIVHYYGHQQQFSFYILSTLPGDSEAPPSSGTPIYGMSGTFAYWPVLHGKTVRSSFNQIVLPGEEFDESTNSVDLTEVGIRSTFDMIKAALSTGHFVCMAEAAEGSSANRPRPRPVEIHLNDNGGFTDRSEQCTWTAH